MGIHGLTSQTRYQRAGKIYLGIKYKSNKSCNCLKKNKNKPIEDCLICRGSGFMFLPKETEYFVLKPTQVPELIEFYGEQPTKLNVMLPRSWELERIFPQWLKRYGANVLKCIGDGKIAKCVNPETLAIEEVPCFMTLEEEGKSCPYILNKECVARAIFNFRITERQNSLKVYQVGTGSINSILNINTALRDIIYFSLTNRIDIADIKLILQREKQKTQRIDKKSKRAVPGTHWIMTLDLDPKYYKSWREVKRLSMGIPVKRQDIPIAELPAPEEIEKEEIMDIEPVEEVKESTEIEDSSKIEVYKKQIKELLKKIKDAGMDLTIKQEEILDVCETEEDYEEAIKVLNHSLKFKLNKNKSKEEKSKPAGEPGELFQGEEQKTK